MDVTIIAEISEEGLHPVTSQLIGAASLIKGRCTVICPGGIGADEATSISGVEKVISVVGDCFEIYDCGAWTDVIGPLADGELVIGAASPTGRELVSSIAAMREIPVIQDVTEISGNLVLSRPIYSGKAIEELVVDLPCAVSLRGNSFDSSGTGGSAELTTINQSSDISISIKEALAKANERIDVSEADIVISGGRGMGDPDNFSKLFEIADEIGAAVGASRAAVDSWDDIPHSMQVGQTGKTVAPSLYIAVGISGAIQHLAGMRTSKYIVAINKDPDAPIFGIADYGIVSTWEEALPILKSEFSKIFSN